MSDLTGYRLAHDCPLRDDEEALLSGQSHRHNVIYERFPRARLDCVGHRTPGIYRRRPRPHHARRFGPRGGRPVHRRPRRAVVVRRAADRRLRSGPGARGPVARPVRLQGADRFRRAGDGGGPADAGVHRVAARGDRRSCGCRPWRRGHVHLGAEAGAALVHAEAGAAGDTADRYLRPARPGALGGAIPGAARRRGVDDGLSFGGRARRGVDRADAGVGEEHPERGGRRPTVHLRARGVGERQDRVAAPRDPAGLLHPYGHPVLGDGLRADVGACPT